MEVVKMKNKILLLFVTSLILFSCKEADKRKEFTNNQGLLVKRLFYSDSTTIKYERTYIRDTVPDGYGKIFFPNGALEFYTEFFNGKRFGKEIRYYLNGKLMREGWHQNDQKDSIWTWYDSLGNIQRKNNWRNGVLTGEQIEYYSNRKIKLCEFYDPHGKISFKEIYDLDGKLLNREGEKGIFIVVKTQHSIYDWKVGEPFTANIYFYFCGSDDRGYVEINRLDDSFIIKKSLVKSSEPNYWFSIDFKKKGIYKLVARYASDSSASVVMKINVQQ